MLPISRDLAALAAMQQQNFGAPLPTLALKLQSERPAYAAAFEPVFGVVPQWNATRSCIEFDGALLDAAGPHADPVGVRVCEEQCRTLIERRGTRSGVAGRVRGRLLRDPGEIPAMEKVAADLGMSARTLRNQLRRESTSFRQVVEDMRETVAEDLLTRTRMTIDEIGERLGYADTSSFVAAFKRWKGVAPGGYRGRPLTPRPEPPHS